MSIEDTIAAAIENIPDTQLGGGRSELADALDAMTDGEIVVLAEAMSRGMKSAKLSAAGRVRAAKVLDEARRTAKLREQIRPRLAATKPFPAAFAQSDAGRRQVAVLARRARSIPPAASFGYAPGWRGRTLQDSISTQTPWGTLGGLRGVTEDVSETIVPRDDVEKAALGMAGLGGLNLGKFFGNLVKGVAPVLGLAAMVPGLGTFAQAGQGILQNLASATQTSTQAQAPAPPPPPPAAEKKLPGWVIPASVAGGVGVLALLLGGRR